MRVLLALVLGAVAVATASPAEALPRFAARNGNECIQCHISPTGGGIRNAYGRNVFARSWLPRRAKPRPADWVDPGGPPGGAEPGADGGSGSGSAAAADDDDAPFFDPEINPSMALGGDLRMAYILIRPEDGATPEQDPDLTSSFFLMQADLYHAMALNRHVTTVLDVGVYSGFEAWALFHWKPEPSRYDLMLRVGRFTPAFGIREVEHQLFTRAGIGLGQTDRDTGLELTGYAGPVTAAVSLVNGTLGDAGFDNHGSERRRFEKAVVSRVSARTELGWARAQLGASLYVNQDSNQANPLFGRSIPTADLAEVGAGVDEVRAGTFATANVGRFTWLGDLVWVRDRFYSDRLAPLRGYASYQELSFLPTQGLDVIGTFEFADPDTELLDNSAKRAGLVVEYFPWAFTELRAMVRKSWDDASPTGGAWDVVLFTHLFM